MASTVAAITEEQWPFIDRASEMADALSLLSPDSGKRTLLVSGESGLGKSFFTKELTRRIADGAPNGIALYVEVSDNEIHAADIESQIALRLLKPKSPSRTDPNRVPERLATGRLLRPLPKMPFFLEPLSKLALWAFSLAYPAVAGLNGALSSAMHGDWLANRALIRGGKALDYLADISRRSPVFLAVDGIQFLPYSTLAALESMFASAGKKMRMVFVERVGSDNKDINADARIRLDRLDGVSATQLVDAVLARYSVDIKRAVLVSSDGVPQRIAFQAKSLGRTGDSRFIGLDLGAIVEQMPNEQQVILYLVARVSRMRREVIERVLSTASLDRLVLSDVGASIEGLREIGLLTIQRDVAAVQHESVRRAALSSLSDEDLDNELQHALATLLADRRVDNDSQLAQELVEAILSFGPSADARLVQILLRPVENVVSELHVQSSFQRLMQIALMLPSAIFRGISSRTVGHIFDAYQKAGEFEKGLDFIGLVQESPPNRHARVCALFTAKYLVQKFDYKGASEALAVVTDGPDKMAVQFNMDLNLCEDEKAASIANALDNESRALAFDELMILRNSGHLFPVSDAVRVVTKAARGFERSGDVFSHASAENNVGVVLAGAGLFTDARNHFRKALDIFDRIHSPERYQALNNLGVLAALDGDRERALALLNDASDAVSRSLDMDSIMLDLNRLMVRSLDLGCDAVEVASTVKELHRRSTQKTRDLRFQWALGWLSLQTQGVATSDCEFEQRVLATDNARMEVFFPLELNGGRKITAFFELSPHWRY